ncbi:hypothetical protein C1645_823153 [Glomus cerebriforme]|uniref:DUF221-domain-containing protein n=1 Tax=Glomus cerebriforme TaxID=658196 RepID=A0A397SZZ2_9GLOM|nr:hypothetical protein C1645_823153 [Glomus cerebriforme]
MSYVPPKEQETKITIAGMYSQLAVNTAIGVGTLIIFGFLRPRNGIVYAPKQKYSSEKKQPPKIENQGIFAWIRPVLSSSEELLIEKIGLDAVMFLRFIQMCRNMFLWLFFLGLAIIGVNLYGTKQDRNQFPKTDNPLQYLSISFLKNARWFWAHVAFTWIFSLIIFRFLYKQYHEYSKLKKQYFKSEEYQSSLHSRTLLITGIPTNMQSDEGLQQYIVGKLKFQQTISQAHISRKVGRLPELIEEHEKNVRSLESVLAKYLKDPNHIPSKRPKHHLGGRCGGEKVDSIEYYTAQIQALEEEIHNERERIKERKAINYGFISFTNIVDAHSVAKKFEGRVSLNEPQIMLAPWPKDIIWANLTLTNAVRGTKRLIGHAFFLLLCFFWLFPIGLLSTAAQIQNIVKIAPFTENIFYANYFIAAFIESWMSPLIMGAFFLVLPQILRILSKHQGKNTKSSLDRSVLAKLYLFFLINNIIIYTVSSTFFDLFGKIRATIDAGNTEFKDIYKVVKEANFLDELADSLIKVSSFWINYISLRGVGAIFDLAQIISLVLTRIKKLFIQPTPRNLKEFSRPPDFDYPVYYNIHLFFFTVGMLYSVIAPLILFFCAAYFSLALLVYRYQLMYVFTTKIETGGTFWRVVFNRLIGSLIFWQGIMIGVMNLKGAHIQSVAILPLPMMTLMVKFICAKRFDAPIRYYKPKKSDPEYNKTISHSNDKVSNRFGHPALSTELITPMVHSNVKHLLSKVYNGRIDETKISRRGTIKSMSMIVGNDNQNFNIQTVDQQELEWDEQAYYEEQKPGYYVDYDDTSSNYSGTTFNSVPQMSTNNYQQRQRSPHPNNSPRLPPINEPNNNAYHKQPRPRNPPQHDNSSSTLHLLRQESPAPSVDNFSTNSDDTASLHRQRTREITNYDNSTSRSVYPPPPPLPQQYNQRGYNQNNNYNQGYNPNNHNQNNNYNQSYNPNNHNQNNNYNQGYNQNNQQNYNYNNQGDRGYNNNYRRY